jgi:hypothetical protein
VKSRGVEAGGVDAGGVEAGGMEVGSVEPLSELHALQLCSNLLHPTK